MVRHFFYELGVRWLINRAIMFHIGIATQHPPLPNSSEMSEQGIAFIQACVTLDPTARPSAAELIGHPWLAHFNEGAVSIFM